MSVAITASDDGFDLVLPLMCLPPGAGADIHNCIDPRPKMYNYSIVQTAANNGHLEAVVKLVEAGASWRVARGVSQCHTVPQILVAKNKGTQVKDRHLLVVLPR